MGIPPSQYGAKQISHPSAAPICVDDRNSEIRRIVIRGLNGARYLTIGQGATSAKLDSYSRTAPSNQRPYYPPTTQSTRPRPRPGPSDESYGDFPPAAPPTGNLSTLAKQTANQVELLRANYAPVVGLWILRDGNVESLGGRRTTASERELFDSLSYLLTTTRNMASPSSGAYDRRRAGQQLQSDTQTAQQRWEKVKSTGVISQDLDRQWQNTLSNLRSLGSAASR
jgi:hypothetical protein